MNVNHNLRRIENVHTRNVHCVKMNQVTVNIIDETYYYLQ